MNSAVAIPVAVWSLFLSALSRLLHLYAGLLYETARYYSAHLNFLIAALKI